MFPKPILEVQIGRSGCELARVARNGQRLREIELWRGHFTHRRRPPSMRRRRSARSRPRCTTTDRDWRRPRRKDIANRIRHCDLRNQLNKSNMYIANRIRHCDLRNQLNKSNMYIISFSAFAVKPKISYPCLLRCIRCASTGSLRCTKNCHGRYHFRQWDIARMRSNGGCRSSLSPGSAVHLKWKE